MDIATLAGMGVGTAVVMLVMLLSGSLLMYWDLLSLVIVLGGAVCATLIRWPLDKFISGLMAGLDAVTNKIDSPEALIDKIEELATTARKESILALEKVSIENEDLEKMIKMAVDGITPDVIDSTFEDEIRSRREKLRIGLTVYEDLGEACPAFGMIGTVVGLIVIMANLSDPSKIGPGLAVALVTTLYGALIANLYCIPIAKKLKFRSSEAVRNLEIMRIGVASILAGLNPRLIRQRLEILIV